MISSTTIYERRTSRAMAALALGVSDTRKVPQQRVLTLRGIINALDRGKPVVLDAEFLMTDPLPDGDWPQGGTGRRAKGSVLIESHSRQRSAFRIVAERGIEWGQAGRAWLSDSAVRLLLERGGKATVYERQS